MVKLIDASFRLFQKDLGYRSTVLVEWEGNVIVWR